MSLPTIFEYLPPAHAAALIKMAEPQAEEKKEKAPSIPMTLLKGSLGLAGGMAAGYGAGRLGKWIYESRTGKPMPKAWMPIAGTIAGGAANLAYQVYQREMQKELKRGYEALRDRGKGSVPGK